ncbi:hypothetical protein ACNKHX_03365 [Shigella flexneri]
MESRGAGPCAGGELPLLKGERQSQFPHITRLSWAIPKSRQRRMAAE